MTAAMGEQATHDHYVKQTQELIAELEDMALDPTLDQCCRRDIESHITNERIRHSLQLQDRVGLRQRLASAAVCRDAAALAHSLQEEQQHAGAQVISAKTNVDVTAEEAELAELRRQRLAQLQAQSAAKQEASLAGFGTLNDVTEGNLLGLMSEPPGQGLLVVHLAVQGYEPCNSLDECLEAAAAQFRGTYFARVVVARSSPLVARLQLPHGVPALLVCREGSILGKAHISQFGAHDVWEEEVLSYLRRFKVLSSGSSTAGQQRSSSTQAAQDSDTCSDGEESDSSRAGDWATPCEVCGRTYAHTHVRALYSTQQQHSDDGSGSED